MNERETQQLGYAIAVLLVALTLGWWLYGDSFERHCVLSDLHDYASAIRRSDIPVACKEHLLSILFDLEDQVRVHGAPPGWSDLDEATREMLREQIDHDDVRLIRLHLDRALARASDQ